MHIQNQIKPNLIPQNFEDCDVTQVILGQSSRQAKWSRAISRQVSSFLMYRWVTFSTVKSTFLLKNSFWSTKQACRNISNFIGDKKPYAVALKPNRNRVQASAKIKWGQIPNDPKSFARPTQMHTRSLGFHLVFLLNIRIRKTNFHGIWKVVS